jgi:hypothetical protein
MAGPHLVFSITGFMGTDSRAYVTSYLVLTRVATLMDSLPSLDGIQFVPPDLYLFTFDVG